MNSNDIYTALIAKCPQHKRNMHYLQRYVKFIYACLNRNETIHLCYVMHKHHILPKADSLWPEYKNFTKHPWNMARLTTKQHTIAHWMLARALGGGMWLAYNYLKRKPDLNYLTSVDIEAMVNVRIVKTGHEVSAETREKISERIKLQHLNKTPEERLAYKLAHVGKTHSNAAKQKLREFQLGRPKSDETKRKLSESHKGKTYAKQKTVECPHCTKVGKFGAMNRWHFDNCNLKPA